jgi:hypothetical protein
MEGLTRLVSESLARHGFDRPLDYRRLHWSRWFRCESHHSLLFVPSKPGVFALAEEIIDFDATRAGTAAPVFSTNRVGADAFVRPAERSSAITDSYQGTASAVPSDGPHRSAASAAAFPEVHNPKPESASRRMLAVTQFFEDDDMAFVLDRMLSHPNAMRARLSSGRYFVRFVVIEDQTQRRSICNALNQWMVSTAEKATGIGSHFASSLELTPATEFIPQRNDAQATLFEDLKADVEVTASREGHDFSRAEKSMQISPALASEGIAVGTTVPKYVERPRITSPSSHLESGASSNIHCPFPLPPASEPEGPCRDSRPRLSGGAKLRSKDCF